jgi:4'-phosphopantetheinyl transferase
MDEKRRLYLNSLKHTKNKLLSVAAEWLVKENVAKILNKPIEEVVILREEKGKPYIEGNPLYISISHSGDFVAVAIHAAPVGIDIEELKAVHPKLKDRICTDSDLEFLNEGKNEIERNEKTLLIWTAKEAYFKKIGTGITDFKSISYKNIKASHSIQNSYVITTVI